VIWVLTRGQRLRVEAVTWRIWVRPSAIRCRAWSWRVAPGVVGLRLDGRGARQVQVAYKFIDAEGVSREQCGGDRDSHQNSRIRGRE